MADVRPDLDAFNGAFWVPATVTVPGAPPVQTVAMEIAPFVVRFPSDSGNWSMTKSRRRFSLRLDHLSVTEVPFGTLIEMASETVTVEATDYVDNQVAHVLARKVV